jgi:uncharacterized protein (TIGR02246 family)
VSDWVKEYFDTWNGDDVEKVVDWMTDDVDIEDVTVGHHTTGKDAARKFVEASFRKVPDATYEVIVSRTSDDAYWIEWVMKARGVDVRGASVGTRRDGKISSNHDYWNGALFKV